MEEYFFPFQDVRDINVVLNNENLYFDYFDSLHFCTSIVRKPSRNNSSLDEKYDLINNEIKSTIHQCKYYDSQRFQSIFQCNRFSLLFDNINSFNANFDAYLLSHFSTSGFMPKILAFCETKCTPVSEHLYSIPGYNSVFRNQTSNSGGLAFYI